MDGAVFFTKLSAVSKNSSKPGTAAAHLKYIMRKSAAVWELSEHFPEDYVEGIKFMHRRERDSRKNAQVCSKVIINLPYALNDEQRKAMVHDLCQKAGMGRIPYKAVAHYDTDSPHVHIIFIDADIETGQRVFGFSKAGGLWRWRGLVETVENAHLEAAGSTYRVSRYGKDSQQHQELNTQAREKRLRYEGATPQHAPKRRLETTALSPHLPPKQEERVVDKLKVDDNDFRDSVQALLTAKRELQAINTAQRAAEKNAASIELAQAAIAKNAQDGLNLAASSRARNEAAYSAYAYWSEYNGIAAKLRGLFSRDYRTRRANAWYAYKAHSHAAELHKKALIDTRAEAFRLTGKLATLEATKFALQRRLGNVGDKQEIEDLKTLHSSNLGYYADRLAMLYEPKLEKALKAGEITPESYEATKQILERRKQAMMNQAAAGYKH